MIEQPILHQKEKAMEETYKYLIKDIEDLHRKAYLKFAIASNMHCILGNKYTREEGDEFVNQKFKNMGVVR